MSLLIRDGEIGGHHCDVRIVGDRIAEVAGEVTPRPGDVVIDAAKGTVLPGLVDHHLHLHAVAAALTSTQCGPPSVRTRPALAAALALADADEFGWVRGTGYFETVAGALDIAELDLLHRERPVRVQHRSGALWTVNSLGAFALGLDSADHPGVERDPAGRPTGRLWRADNWLRARLPRSSPPALDRVGSRLTELGITHVTDATPDLDDRALSALASGLPQRVHALGVPLGTVPPSGLTTGPYKIVIADSDLPDPDTLGDTIRAAHAVHRGVAAHCVTREALLLFLVALETAGSHPADRVEHASLIPQATVSELARRGLRVVTQPGFLADRGSDYLRDVPPEDHGDLYRCASLAGAGIPVALSSDAPYGPLDPWAVIASAVTRHAGGAADDGRVIGAGERLSPQAALDAYLGSPHDPGGPPRTVSAGAPADLIVLDRPLAAQLERPDSAAVRTVVIGGAVAHAR